MCATVLGVVRSAARLELLVHEARDAVDREHPWRVEHVCELRPLAQHRSEGPSARPELWSAWRALGAVTSWDAVTRGHVLAVLRETVPSSDTQGELPALGPEVHAPPPPRATAAHPRAFRGTRHRPPKPPQPAAVDIRPYLLVRRHVDRVLELVGQRGDDPAVALFRANAGFDPAFVMWLLPLLGGCTSSEVGAFAALARSLELHREPALRAALVGVFLAAEHPARTLGWWSHVLAHAPTRRLDAARLVYASGVAKLDAMSPELAAELGGCELVQQWSCYRGLARGATPAYLLSGLELGAISHTTPSEPAAGSDDVTAIVQTTVARLADAMIGDSGAEFWRSHLWRLCGAQPELVDLLARSDFIALRPEAAFELVRLANSPGWTPETAVDEWRELAPKLRVLVEIAAGVPTEYQCKFVEHMQEVYWRAVANARAIAMPLANAVDWCVRVARAPFSTSSVLGPMLAHLALVEWDDGRDQRALRDVPDASLLALEQACRRENQARILGRGLARFARLAPKLLVCCFATAPKAVLHAADLLSAVSFETAEQLFAAYSASPLADPALAEAPVRRLCEVIEPIARAGGHDPVRRALRQHLAGKRTLSEAQLRGHRARIVADLDLVRVASISQAIERTLAARVGLEQITSSTVRHALAMLDEVEVHRRQLRRMLTAILAGDRDWRRRHPRSQQWIARHPKLAIESWLGGGIEMRAAIEGIGDVVLAIETDPLEALELGTYVGSCLGRGGYLTYSAAAVVLDINKHVIYARDAHGAVVGRQLVAISEADELVCFYVYGTVKPGLLEPAFRELDHALAAKLGIPLFTRHADATYEIASILSHQWWDDSAWSEVVAR